MAGISSKALTFGEPGNRKKWNKGSELESKEFCDGTGIEVYSTFYRSLDPQIGRFWQIDPKPSFQESLFASMRNNPILFNDPMGDSILDKRDRATADRIVHRSNNKIAANEKNISDNNLAIQKGKAELAAGDLSEKKIKSLNKEIEKLLKENIELTSKNEYLSTGIDAIENLRTDMNHNYSFESGSNDGSHYVIQGKGKNVKVQGSSDGLLLHESVHILQSAKAEGLKFSQGGKLFNSSFTRVGQINNEVQSYRVQFSFDGTFIPDEPSSNLSDINSEVVGRHY